MLLSSATRILMPKNSPELSLVHRGSDGKSLGLIVPLSLILLMLWAKFRSVLLKTGVTVVIVSIQISSNTRDTKPRH